MGTVAPEGTPWEQQAKDIAKRVTKAQLGESNTSSTGVVLRAMSKPF